MPFCSPIRYFASMNLLLPAPQSKRICKVRTHKTWRFSQTHSENGKKTFFSVSSSRPPYKPEEIDVRLKKQLIENPTIYSTKAANFLCQFSIQLIQSYAWK